MKKAIVIHSGGMDSSICLALAIQEFGSENVISLSFNYTQRHSIETIQAKKITSFWNVEHTILTIDVLAQITKNALTDLKLPIEHKQNEAPNTLVVGRNGLMARIGAIFATKHQANVIYMGVMELESANSGYRDCSRAYMDLKQEILRIDLDNPSFEIRTPLVFLTKMEALVLANKLGVLPFLLQETITCYEGKSKLGCTKCPACLLRNEGLRQFKEAYPQVTLPF